MLAELQKRAMAPFQLVGLIDLKPYGFYKIDNLAQLWFGLSDGAFRQGDDFFKVTDGTVLDADHKKKCHRLLDNARSELEYVNLVQSAKYVSNIKTKLDDGTIETYKDYQDQTSVLWELVINEIEGTVFGFIPKDHGKYFNQAALFGVEVNDKFPDAAYDIKQAGNCYANGTYTASVFHLMRVLEIALHYLANELGLVFPATIELENWQNIIEKIESEITAREKRLPKGAAKSEEMQHYSEAAKEFRYFKNAWRNHVSHSREDYDVNDATKIMSHVKDFMEHLAARK